MFNAAIITAPVRWSVANVCVLVEITVDSLVVLQPKRFLGLKHRPKQYAAAGRAKGTRHEDNRHAGLCCDGMFICTEILSLPLIYLYNYLRLPLSGGFDLRPLLCRDRAR